MKELKGNFMNMIKTKVAGRVAAAVALSLGLAAGAVSVASASPHGIHHSRHDNGGPMWTHTSRVEGVVSSYTAGSSISITTKGSTTPTAYTLTSTTPVTGTYAMGDRALLELSGTTPATVLSVKFIAPKPIWVEGVVSSYTAGSSISITTKGSTTPTAYTLTSTTPVTGTYAMGDRALLELSGTTPATVLSVKFIAPKPIWVEGVVSSYTAGSSISITTKGSTTPTAYTLTSTTPVTGTYAMGDRALLELSGTTPATVLSVKFIAPKPIWVEGVVSSYTAGSSISITTKGSTTPTAYTLTSTTPVTGTYAMGDRALLELSGTTPATVLSVKFIAPLPIWNGGQGIPMLKAGGSKGHGFGIRGSFKIGNFRK